MNLNQKLGSLQGVVNIQVVKKASVMYYQEKLVNFLKVYVHLPSSVAKARQMIENGELRLRGKPIFGSTTYESNMPFALRYMIDMDINGMQWVQFQKGNYVIRQRELKKSTC